jgi:hypothetical protein
MASCVSVSLHARASADESMGMRGYVRAPGKTSGQLRVGQGQGKTLAQVKATYTSESSIHPSIHPWMLWMNPNLRSWLGQVVFLLANFCTLVTKNQVKNQLKFWNIVLPFFWLESIQKNWGKFWFLMNCDHFANYFTIKSVFHKSRGFSSSH